MSINFKKLLNIGNVLKVVSLVDALKDLKGKSKTEAVTDGIPVVEAVLGIEVLDESRIEVLIRNIEAWAKQGEALAREGEALLKQVRAAVSRGL